MPKPEKDKGLSQEILDAIQKLRENPYWMAFENSLGPALDAFISRIDSWAEHLKSPVNPGTPGGGIVIDFLRGLLDPDVYSGVKAIKDSAEDPGAGHGLWLGPIQRAALQRVLDDIDGSPPPPPGDERPTVGTVYLIEFEDHFFDSNGIDRQTTTYFYTLDPNAIVSANDLSADTNLSDQTYFGPLIFSQNGNTADWKATVVALDASQMMSSIPYYSDYGEILLGASSPPL